MEGITVFMALVDFVPVLFFFAAAVLLLKDLYNKMVKGCYAMLAAGAVMVLIGGIYKVMWKCLVALQICDYPILSDSMFPLHAPGFFLVFAALVGIFTKTNKKYVTMNSSALPVFVSNMPFIIVQTAGCAGVQAMLAVIAVKMKKKLPIVCFIVAFVFMLGMGYLSAKFDDSSSMHWIAQVTNIISQGALFLGTWLLHKAGLGEKEALF